MTNIDKPELNTKDLTGLTFNNLTVIGISHYVKWDPYWTCKCSCGNVKPVSGRRLRSGRTKSCGCLKVSIGTIILKHGNASGKRTKEYQSWCGIKRRCTNKKNVNYGGRGIVVCDRWISSFENFLADMGPAPSKNHSLERNNVNGNYEPSNCRWATRFEQCNNRRTNVFYEINGSRKTISQLCEDYKIVQYETAYSRIKLRNWDVMRAVTTPSLRNQKPASAKN